MIDLELRIGIVLNYKKAEQKKDELYSVNKYPWLKSANDPKYKDLVITKPRKNGKYVPADVAIGLFLESLPQNEEIKIIIDVLKQIKKQKIIYRFVNF